MSGLSTEDRQGYMRIGQARQRICSSNPRDVVTGLLSLRDFGVLDPSLSDALGPPGQAIPPSDLESLMEDLGYMSTLRIGPLSHERHWEQCLKTLRAFLVDHKTYVWSAQGRQHQRHLLLEPDWVRFQLVFNPRSTQQTVRVIGPGAAELGTLLAENYPDSERNPIGRQNDLEGLRRQGFRSISVQHDLTKDKDDEGPGLFDGLEPGTEAPLAPAMYALRRLLLTLPLVEVLILRASRLSHAQKLKAARAAAAQQAMQQAQANGGSNFGTLGGGRGGQDVLHAGVKRNATSFADGRARELAASNGIVRTHFLKLVHVAKIGTKPCEIESHRPARTHHTCSLAFPVLFRPALAKRPHMLHMPSPIELHIAHALPCTPARAQRLPCELTHAPQPVCPAHP